MSTNVYGLFLPRAGARIAARCAEYDVDATGPLLLVMACDRGPQQLASAVASWGERPLTVDKDGKIPSLVLLRAPFLVDFASQHPGRLIAKVENGHPPARAADGTRPVVWADLGAPGEVEVGDPRAHTAAAS